MIRPYRPSDLDDVLAVWFEAAKLAHPFLTEEFFAGERERIRDVYLPAARSWVYERQGHLVGFVSLVGNEVGGLFVHPDQHRCGVGRALVDTVRDSTSTLEVEVFEGNSIGRSFYEQYGFRAIGESVHEQTGRPMLRLRYEG